jgi:hypothetical protein
MPARTSLLFALLRRLALRGDIIVISAAPANAGTDVLFISIASDDQEADVIRRI